jgi:energy-coupling factor transporter ATP-binding protein EcfA2
MIDFSNLGKAEDLIERALPLQERLKERLNLPIWKDQKPVEINQNVVYRLALAASLSRAVPTRRWIDAEGIRLKDHIHQTTFTRHNLSELWSALVRLRWAHESPDWSQNGVRSRIVNWEILQGLAILDDSETLETWLSSNPGSVGPDGGHDIPVLDLLVGEYEGGIDARLDLNGRAITNTQILVAGTTGSGKSNLLAVLLHEIRQASVETARPVNFLLFDYKGEFSDPANADWLSLFSVDASCIVRPVEAPLPFTPFKDYRGRTQGEVNLYASELAGALLAIDRANISAKMGDRLTQAVIQAYGETGGAPVDFEGILDAYCALQEKDTVDSVRAVLNNLIRANLFSREDRIDPIGSSLVVKMDDFPKDGPIAKALVYFTISKLNSLYEKLPKQATNSTHVELRHFTVIDEAHYMLDFDNRPLRELIAVGRNKGLSIILATQNMASFKSDHFDFYANAQYPLLMKQQSIRVQNSARSGHPNSAETGQYPGCLKSLQGQG